MCIYVHRMNEYIFIVYASSKCWVQINYTGSAYIHYICIHLFDAHVYKLDIYTLNKY